MLIFHGMKTYNCCQIHLRYKRSSTFNKVTETEGGIRVTAGSAPDALNIGSAIRIDNDVYIASFKVLLKDPKEAVDITITPGQGKFRDGLLDRYGQRWTRRILTSINFQHDRVHF